MSLKAFHLLFCVTVFTFFFYFGLWCFEEYSAFSQPIYLVFAVLALTMGILTPFYLNWFLKKLKGIGFVVFWLTVICATRMDGCPVCVGDPNHPMVRSANNGVLFLLLVTGSVLIPMAALFIYWAFKARRQSMISS